MQGEHPLPLPLREGLGEGSDASAPTAARDGQARPAEGVEATRDSPFPTDASTPWLSVDSKRGPTGGDGGMARDSPLPPPPPPLDSPSTPSAGRPAGTEAWQGKSNPAFTAQMGQDMGITVTMPPAGDVSISATALTQSQVALKAVKAGHEAVAVESLRGGGSWEQITIMIGVDAVDARPPLVVGQPEQRQYRAQAYDNNQRVGPYSAIVAVVTVP